MAFEQSLVHRRHEIECSTEVDLNRRGLRIASIFIILASSLLGALLPLFLSRLNTKYSPKNMFFVFKFIGTGVIIATAWMHLLSPAVEALHSECLADKLGEYDWVFFIALMTILLMVLIETLATHFSDSIARKMSGSTSRAGAHNDTMADEAAPTNSSISDNEIPVEKGDNAPSAPVDLSYLPHSHGHGPHIQSHGPVSNIAFSGQIIAILILEFGVIFHSVFIGLVLSTTDEVVVLTIVLVFHQLMEGLGLGSRLAAVNWPEGRGWWPFLLSLLYAVSTPIGIAAGLGARPNNGNTQTLINGIFDSISGGILMYTGLVELLAHEFMFNEDMNRSPLRVKFAALSCVGFGAGVMALLAKWA
ncbi:Zinc-regulated transporter 1 [Ceratocystis fimbriata CBS 114723]|uniref:Zinc-regulated transporter 1 n=1 Tax=Ceratocystis fimbriata CBS 114723 TaxID=1035309 RepID=A0A2C5X2C4_9PEZI|nr:Zinc-regulated transporter 1 [Ceratocystis fimbriata CBS 114723]